MQVIENRNYTSRTALMAKIHRVIGTVMTSAAQMFRSAWLQAFPTHFPDGPDFRPTDIAKAQALREGALLAEAIDAVAKKRLVR